MSAGRQTKQWHGARWQPYRVRRGQRLPPLRLASRLPVRGEYLVVTPRRRPAVPGRHYHDAPGNLQFEPVRCALTRQRRLAARGVAGDIAGDEYRLRAGLGASRMTSVSGLPDRTTRSPPGAQALAQVGEGLQQEAGPVRRRGHQPGVHGEQGTTMSACAHAVARAGLSRTRSRG